MTGAGVTCSYWERADASLHESVRTTLLAFAAAPSRLPVARRMDDRLELGFVSAEFMLVALVECTASVVIHHLTSCWKFPRLMKMARFSNRLRLEYAI
jgi:hypothetical protein